MKKEKVKESNVKIVEKEEELTKEGIIAIAENEVHEYIAVVNQAMFNLRASDAYRLHESMNNVLQNKVAFLRKIDPDNKLFKKPE